MKQETALKLLELATQLACATVSQNTHQTKTKRIDEGGVETVLKDCVKTVEDRFHELTNRAD
ncbi:MAG: hypothetical protein Q8O24_05380 [Gallionellaceae bacterium]|nr:hypothetical protein [Gallionellaceae bacterium]